MGYEDTHECDMCDFCDEECAGTEHEPCHFWPKEEKKKWNRKNKQKLIKYSFHSG